MLQRHCEDLRGARLRFVKRIGDKFPGNEAPGYAGTTTQEVLRALIARTQYVDAQIPDAINAGVITHLRQAFQLLEIRAAYRRNDDAAACVILVMTTPETEPVCTTCGHVLCSEAHDARL